MGIVVGRWVNEGLVGGGWWEVLKDKIGGRWF